MVLNTCSRIAVKCSECGKYNIVDLNIFKIKIPTIVRCDCGYRMLKAHVNKSQLILDIDCIACEEHHNYSIKLKEVVKTQVDIISCPLTGMEIAFLGKDVFVDDIVKRYIDDMKELLKSIGAIDVMATKVVK
jgi:hypothetical protein